MNKIKRIKDLVDYLIKENKTISTMESCTGGYIANAITNIEGASNIFEYGLVTYSNEYKIKNGVKSDTIDKYTVYSIEVAKEMSKVVNDYTGADYSIGVTGQLKRKDENNITDYDNRVYISIYDRNNDKYYNDVLIVDSLVREDNKNKVVEKIIEIFDNIL